MREAGLEFRKVAITTRTKDTQLVPCRCNRDVTKHRKPVPGDGSRLTSRAPLAAPVVRTLLASCTAGTRPVRRRSRAAAEMLMPSICASVKVEAGPETDSREIFCRACGGPLAAREGKFVLKYFLLRKGTRSRRRD